jgi:hypothetical protein
MNEQQFKASYITQFLASYMASTYDFDCQNGHPGEPYNHQPIEDASFLADCAWNQLREHNKEIKTLDETLFTFD